MGAHVMIRAGATTPAVAQRGQALAESLLVLGVLAALVVALTWLGRLQDLGLQLAHASRHAAFAHAHQGADDVFAGVREHFAAPGHAWGARSGALLAEPVAIAVESVAPAPVPAPGDPVAAASQWRAELALGDPPVWRATASAQTAGEESTTGKLRDFDGLGLALRRHTSILHGSGAAPGDAEVQQRLAGSAHAWRDLADVSRQYGREAQQRLQDLDAAWGRRQPTWDWLSSWAGEVPQPYLRARRQP